MMTKILIAGDYVPRFRITEKLNNEDYSFFDEVKALTNQADYSIVNLECPLVLHEAHPIEKSGPNLKCETVHVMDSLKYAGFDCVTLANNHFRDFGDVGVADTLDACQKYGIDYVGGGTDVNEAERILYKEIDGKRFAFINCCEHEFSIATENNGGSNPLNPLKQFYAIKEARNNSDYVIVIVHGGTELYNLPTPRMKETYRFFVDAGADAVINHHQHCYSGYEIYNGKPIFYGLGNLCFDLERFRINDPWNTGFVVTLLFDENTISFEASPFEQCAQTKASVHFFENTKTFSDTISSLNEKISQDEVLTLNFRKMSMGKRERIDAVLSPYSNRIIKVLNRKGLIPSFISSERKMLLLALSRCEAHRDVMIECLENNYK